MLSTNEKKLKLKKKQNSIKPVFEISVNLHKKIYSVKSIYLSKKDKSQKLLITKTLDLDLLKDRLNELKLFCEFFKLDFESNVEVEEDIFYLEG